MDFIPWTSFDRLVGKYGGDVRVRRFRCTEQFRAMAFAQLTCRWHVAFDGRCAVAAHYLVDATGRAAAVARRLGVRRRLHDRLVALTALVPRNPAFDYAMAIATAA